MVSNINIAASSNEGAKQLNISNLMLSFVYLVYVFKFHDCRSNVECSVEMKECTITEGVDYGAI